MRGLQDYQSGYEVSRASAQIFGYPYDRIAHALVVHGDTTFDKFMACFPWWCGVGRLACEA